MLNRRLHRLRVPMICLQSFAPKRNAQHWDTGTVSKSRNQEGKTFSGILATNEHESSRIEARKWQLNNLKDRARPEIIFVFIRVHSWLKTFRSSSLAIYCLYRPQVF